LLKRELTNEDLDNGVGKDAATECTGISRARHVTLGAEPLRTVRITAETVFAVLGTRVQITLHNISDVAYLEFRICLTYLGKICMNKYVIVCINELEIRYVELGRRPNLA
jgi:hypothetical protein